MAGLYIHLPFCKSRCIYCAFYSTTQHERMDDYVTALCKEMELRSTPPSSLHTPHSSFHIPHSFTSSSSGLDAPPWGQQSPR